MVRLNEVELVRFLENNDTYDDIVKFKKANNHHEDELLQYARVLMDEDNNATEEDPKEFFSTILFNQDLKKKRKEKEDDISVGDDDIDDFDPQYELVLESLKVYGNSYLLEGVKDGKPFVAKYEEDHTDSDNEHDLVEPMRKLSVNKTDEINAAQTKSVEQSKEIVKEYENTNLFEGEKDGKTVAAKVEEAKNSNNEFEPTRELRSCKKQVDKFSINIAGEEEIIKDKHDAKSKTEINAAQRIPMEKVVEVENVEHSSDVNEVDSDSDSCLFFRDFKIEDGCGVYEPEGHRIVYWTADAGDDLEHGDEVDEGSSDDVEILDFNPSEMNMDNPTSPVKVAEFKELLINVIRNPYDIEEYNKLLADFKSRKPQLRHKDLRGGREISCPTGQEGKSYHDRYQDIVELLSLYKNDHTKSLNILRGFFFWLQNISHHGAFKPWQDEEYLMYEDR